MSTFKDKLSRLKEKKERSPNSDPKRREIETEDKASQSKLLLGLREKIDKISGKYTAASASGARPARVSDINRLDLPGQEMQTDVGSILLVKKKYSPSYRHGRFPARDFLDTGKGICALAKNEFKSFDPLKAVFLDTETTGLAGGTGTLPFLLGLGWFETSGHFTVNQLFCREPFEEAAQLTLAASRLESAGLLVTFNGKAFDMPLLNTRFILNRIKNPAACTQHLDLLFLARRIFKRRLKNCSLQNLESAVLGYERVGDIPGSEIPSAYRDFLRGGPIEPIVSILNHNALDLVGLAALASAMEEMYINPQKVEHAADHLGLARAALAGGDREFAMDHLQRAGEMSVEDDSKEAYFLAARDASKHRDDGNAKELLSSALKLSPEDPYIHLALAKHLEHRDKNYEAAIFHAAKTEEAEGTEASNHRIERLKRKLKK